MISSDVRRRLNVYDDKVPVWLKVKKKRREQAAGELIWCTKKGGWIYIKTGGFSMEISQLIVEILPLARVLTKMRSHSKNG